jgi:hypothetical protein
MQIPEVPNGFLELKLRTVKGSPIGPTSNGNRRRFLLVAKVVLDLPI